MLSSDSSCTTTSDCASLSALRIPCVESLMQTHGQAQQFSERMSTLLLLMRHSACHIACATWPFDLPITAAEAECVEYYVLPLLAKMHAS